MRTRKDGTTNTPKGYNMPQTGRKLCTGRHHQGPRWLPLCYFHVAERSTRGVPLRFQTMCSTCSKINTRERLGYKPRRPNRASREEVNRRARERYAARRRSREYVEKQREYQRIWAEVQRRKKGIKPRPVGPKSKRRHDVVISGNANSVDAAPLLEFVDRWLEPWQAEHQDTERPDHERGLEALGRASGLSSRSWRRIRQTGRVHLATADRVLVALDGPPLLLLYPADDA